TRASKRPRRPTRTRSSASSPRRRSSPHRSPRRGYGGKRAVVTHPDAALVVSAARMMSWIETVCAQGSRRPGSAPHRPRRRDPPRSSRTARGPASSPPPLPSWRRDDSRRPLSRSRYPHETRKSHLEEAGRGAASASRSLVRGEELTMFDRITFDPHIMGGRACIRGMRIPVSVVVGQIAHGASFDEVLAGYPDLERQDIEEALRYAAWLAQEQVKLS